MKKAPKGSKTVEIAPDGFINMLMNLNGGAVLDELDRAIIEGMQAIHDNGGKAEINFNVKLGYTQGLEHTVTIEDAVKTKFPKEKRPKSLMFETNGCGLVTQHQEQSLLELSQTEPAKQTLEAATKSNVQQLSPAR
jgi:hypothetical protein